MQKNFGQPVTKILHVFDPKVDAQNSEPISSLAKYLEKQLGELLPMLGVKPISVSCYLLQMHRLAWMMGICTSFWAPCLSWCNITEAYSSITAVTGVQGKSAMLIVIHSFVTCFQSCRSGACSHMAADRL